MSMRPSGTSNFFPTTDCMLLHVHTVTNGNYGTNLNKGTLKENVYEYAPIQKYNYICWSF